MSLFDSFGESLKGITDSVVSGGQELLGAWVEKESNDIKSAAPEESRPPVQPAAQPTGQPLRPDYKGALADMKPLLYGGGALMLLMFALALFMGRGR